MILVRMILKEDDLGFDQLAMIKKGYCSGNVDHEKGYCSGNVDHKFKIDSIDYDRFRSRSIIDDLDLRMILTS